MLNHQNMPVSAPMIALYAVAMMIYMPRCFAETSPNVQQEINKSVNAFPGECPCPYSKDKSGLICGGHSAYLLPAHKYRYIPFCYPSDVGPLPVAPLPTQRSAPTPKIKQSPRQSAPDGGKGQWI